MEMWRPLPEAQITLEGFRGMRDVLRPQQDQRDTCFLLNNLMPLDPVHGGPLVMRPGAKVVGDPSSFAGVWQLAYDYRIPGGSIIHLAIKGGAIIRWSGSAWATYISAATLSGASITLSSTARCYAASLGGKVVISDGVNTPFMYDGATTTITKLTNCPVLYGPPTVYYAKLFGIKDTERDTIVWSEENDASTGYEAGGYNNAWQLGQTGGGGLTCLLGTNQGLFYFRASEIGWIRGAVTTEFQNDGTRDGVSETTGTTAPGSVRLLDNAVYFTDIMGRPWMFPLGGDLIPLYTQMSRKFDHTSLRAYLDVSGTAYYDNITLSTDASDIALIQTAIIPNERVVIFAMCSTTSGTNRAVYAVFDHDTRSLQCYWTIASAEYVTTWEAADGEETLVLGLPDASAVANLLYLSYLSATSADQQRAAVVGLVTSAVAGSAVTHELAYSDNVQVAFDRLDVDVFARVGSVSSPIATPTLGVRLQTSNRQITSEMSAEIDTTDLTLTGESIATETRQRQLSFGFAEEGRWARVLLNVTGSIYAVFVNSLTLSVKPRTKVPATNAEA